MLLEAATPEMVKACKSIYIYLNLFICLNF